MSALERRIRRLAAGGTIDPAAIAARCLVSYQAVIRILAALEPVDGGGGAEIAAAPEVRRRRRVRAAAPAPVDPHEPVGCRWIDGDVKAGAWRFCQAEREAGSSYCPAHRARAHRPAGWWDRRQEFGGVQAAAREAA